MCRYGNCLADLDEAKKLTEIPPSEKGRLNKVRSCGWPQANAKCSNSKMSNAKFRNSTFCLDHCPSFCLTTAFLLDSTQSKMLKFLDVKCQIPKFHVLPCSLPEFFFTTAFLMASTELQNSQIPIHQMRNSTFCLVHCPSFYLTAALIFPFPTPK